MAENINLLRRRPPGDRRLIYLDHATVVDLVANPAFADVRDILRRAVQEGLVVCPESLEHSGESLEAERSWEEVASLSDELAMGVNFHDDALLADYELRAAAAEFLGEQNDTPLWREAFDTEPHLPRDALFPGGFRVSARFPPDELRLAEIRNTKSIEDERMSAVYESVRAAGLTFQQQAEREFEEMVYWRLASFSHPGRFLADYERAQNELAREPVSDDLVPDLGPGSPWARLQGLAERLTRVKSLIERYPQLAERQAEFVNSEQVRRLPSLRYPALFRAALALTPGRKAKRGDGFDINHLTKGLSRCDIVTADGSMTQVAISFKLVADDCQLIASRDWNRLYTAVESILREGANEPARARAR